MGLESIVQNGSAMPSLGNTYNATFGAPQMNTQHLPTPSDSYKQSSGGSWLGNLGKTALGVLGSGFTGGLGGLVSSGLGALGNLLFGKKQPSQKELAQMQLENQKDLARYTSELQQQSWLDQFDKMNAREDWLNSNAAAIQKASMKAAGLSVAGFGEGGLSSMASAASPSGATPQTGSGLPSALPSNLAQMTSAFNQSAMLNGQNNLIQSQIDVNESVAQRNLEEAGITKLQAQDLVDFKSIRQRFLEAQSKNEEIQFEIAGVKLHFAAQMEQKNLDLLSENIAHVANLTKNVDLQNQQVQQEIDNFINEWNLKRDAIRAQIKQNLASAGLMSAQANDIINSFDARMRNLWSQTNLNKQQANAAYRTSVSQSRYQNAMSAIQEFEAKVLQAYPADTWANERMHNARDKSGLWGNIFGTLRRAFDIF